jgi:uncharacterized protein YdaU (DUF1376 family)
MAKDPAFLFYPNDWLGGTLGMTFEEKGAYMDLLMMQFNRGHMTGHMVGHVVGQLWDKLKLKFVQDEQGLYYNKRMEEELNKRQAYIQSRFNNKVGKNQYHNSDTNSTTIKRGHMLGHMEDEDVNENKDLINYKLLIENFHFYCDKLSKVERLSTERKKHIRARFKEFDFDTMVEVFKKVGKSDFLCGKNDRCWKASFDWIFNETNFLKIMENKYENKSKFNPEIVPEFTIRKIDDIR